MPNENWMTNVDRALLIAEWSAADGPDRDAACPCCRAWLITGARHEPDCPMDLALAERGFAVQEDRDRSRAIVMRRQLADANTLPPPKDPDR